MDLYSQILESYPDLSDSEFEKNGAIELVDDGDGVPYIARWDYDKPLPQGLKLGK
jgi:hypothetical protein